MAKKIDSVIKPKVLLLQPDLKLYRLPVWNLIADKCDLVLGFLSNDSTKNSVCLFQKQQFAFVKVGPLSFVKGLRQYCNQFDVVIFMPDPHVPSFCILPFLPHKYKLLTWSIGFRCSYEHPYLTQRRHDIIDKFYELMFRRVNANIFYMEKSKEFWKHSDLDFNRIFVAPNTVEVSDVIFDADKKKNVLFVGTLYRGKGLDLLLTSYKNALARTGKLNKLVIVGGGEMKEEIETFIAENHLKDKVALTGPIYEEKELSKHFSEALICVSPTQGGLSCPKSMGYGVPFVCRKDAITGGEIYHMEPGVNGIMYENDGELEDIIVDAIDNPKKYVAMGIKAKEYYENNATPKHMAEGVMEAVHYTIKH